MYKRILPILALIVLSLALAGCGSKAPGVASLEGEDSTRTAQPAKNQTDEEKVMAFVRAMRDEGFEFKDPVVDAEGFVQKPELADGVEWTAEIKEVYGEYTHLLEGVTFAGKKTDARDVERYVELAEALREAGVDIDDPTAETLEAWLADLKAEIDWDDPDVTEVYDTWAGKEGVGKMGKDDGGRKK